MIIVYLLLFFAAITAVAEIFTAKSEKGESLKKPRFHQSGKVNKLFIAKLKFTNMLQLAGIPAKGFYAVCISSAVLGFTVGKLLVTTNILVAAFIITFASIPPLYLRVRVSWYTRAMSEQLETTMSIITNAYLSNFDIVDAIESNLHQIPINTPFKEFLAEVKYVDASIERALRKLAIKLNNEHYTQWTDILILSQQDHDEAFILPSIVAEMNDIKRFRVEADTQISEAWREYLTLLILAVSIPFILLRVVNMEWYMALMGTTIGQIIVLSLLGTTVWSLYVAVKINKPVEL